MAFENGQSLPRKCKINLDRREEVENNAENGNDNFKNLLNLFKGGIII